MKKLRLYIVALVLALATGTGVQAQVLRDADFNAIGRISGNGVVRDAASRSIGSFDDDGTVRDKAGPVLGRIARLEIFNAQGDRIGYITSDGNVRDGSSQPLGNINLNDGKVTDAAHNTLGYARGIRVDWIACYFLFDFFK